MFICCGRKNQLMSTRLSAMAVKLKYFLTQFFLLLTKKAMTACVGQAQSRLKLFRHMG